MSLDLAEENLQADLLEDETAMDMKDRVKHVIFDRKNLLTESLSNALGRRDRTMIFTVDDRLIDGSIGTPLAIPALVLMCDQLAPQAAGFGDRIAALQAAKPDLKLAVLSDREDVDDVVRALRLGAHGYIPTSLPLQVVVQALRLIFAGGIFVPSSSLTALSLQPKVEVEVLDLISKGLFTDRELIVAKALRKGMPNKQISLQMGIYESTVKMLVRNIMRKLNAKNRTEVAFLTHRLLDGTDTGS